MNNMGFEGERRHTVLRNNMMREYRMRDNMRQGSMCSSNNDCGDERFCNFDNENNGYCESCSHINDCESEDFTTKRGMVACMQRCEYHDKYDTMNSNNNFMRFNNMRRDSSCTSNGDCDGDDWFCDFENENTGYCQSCSYFNSCEDAGFTNKHGMVSCMETCEYHDKRDDMNDMDFEGERRHTVLRKTRPNRAEAAVGSGMHSSDHRQ